MNKECLDFLIKCLKLTGNFTYHQANIQQDRQCTYNVTSRRFRVTIGAVEKQYYIFWACVYVCVWSLSYQAFKAHASYCYLPPAPLYSIFPHYL